MKKILIALGVILLLLVAAVVAIPFLVPKDRIVARVAQEVEAATGRSLTVDGDVGVSIFPNVGVTLNDVTFANMEGGEEPYLAHLDSLVLSARLLPLLSGEVVVDSFVMQQPDIRLEVAEDGRANWSFDAGGGESAPAEGEQSAEDGESGGVTLPEGELTLGDVRIVDGRLSYRDDAGEIYEEVTGIGVTLGLESLDSAFSLDGSAIWHDEEVGLDGEVTTLRRLLEGQPAEASLAVSAEPVEASFGGEAQLGEAASLNGDLELNVPSLRSLFAWATSAPLNMPGEGMESFALTGAISATPGRVALSDARVILDAIEGTGSFAVESGERERPLLTASLDVGALDLNPYIPDSEGGPSGGESEEQQAQSQEEAGQEAAARAWSDEPIDVSGLGALDADLRFSADAMIVGAIETGATELALTLDNRLLTADLEQFAIYEGEGSGEVQVNARGEAPFIAADFAMSGLQIEPLLIAVADFNRLAGQGDLDFDVETQGASELALVEALNGRGAFRFTDGAIRGVNIAGIIRNATAALRGQEPEEEAQQTDFTELAGTFTIENGIVSNNDLAMQSPLLRVEGQGRVDLPEKSVPEYRVTPRAVASLEGQGGENDLSGVLVPIIVSGPFDDLSFQPDVEGILRQNVGEPEELLRQLEDRLGGGSGQSGSGDESSNGESSGDESGSVEDRARDALRQLLPGSN